ncbi:MAG: lysostaphin resistance A-like protein [Phycisphaerales bacterium]
MDPLTVLMLAMSCAAAGIIAWMAATRRLTLPPQPPQPPQHNSSSSATSTPTPGADAIMLLTAAAGILLIASFAASITISLLPEPAPIPTPQPELATPNAPETTPTPAPDTLTHQAITNLASTGIGIAAMLALILLWPTARQAIGRFSDSPRTTILACLLILPLVHAVGTITVLTWTLINGSPPPLIAHNTLATLMASERTLGWWAMIAAVIIAAPIFEELLYRGLLLSATDRALAATSSSPRNAHLRWAAITIAAIAFALVHAGIAAWTAMPSLIALAIALGWLRIRTGGIIAPIIVHAAFNAMNLALALRLTA